MKWITSYLSDRNQFVRHGQSRSSTSAFTTGVPQWSVLGPILFSLYISPISAIASKHHITQQQYADDTQLYTAISCKNTSTLHGLQECLLSLHSWFSHNGLALNPDKSDAVLFGTRQAAQSLGSITSVDVAGTPVALSDSVKLLDVILDRCLALDSHVGQIVHSSHFHTRALRRVRNALTEGTEKSVGQALVSFRLDYANSILYGVSRPNLKKLQRSQNTLARVVTRFCHRDSATTMLRHLRWFPIKERIDFKVVF